MINISLEARSISIGGSSYNKIGVELELDERELDSIAIAENISIDTFFEALGEGAIKEYAEKNYDWFDDKD